MPLPDSFLQELLRRNDIESVASSYVQFKRRGRNLVGLCPFHNEKTPSFNLYPENNSFYCFGCGAGGDVITFIKRIENLDYMDAVKLLADRAGLHMPDQIQQDDAVSKLRLRVLEANRDAARCFHQWLYAPCGQQALDYLHGRGYTDATIRHFGLGYAPDSYDSLRSALRSKGYTEQELDAAFLCKRGRNNALYDIFRNRVMVPIIDIRGNVVAFGGRVLDDSKPKYLNTADTPAFKKNNHLFALNFAKSAPGRQLILCEGYMDVIAMHQAGFTNAVAALGTAFNDEHAKLVARYADEALLIFDADEAGQKATKRAITYLRNTGIRMRVVRIPDGKDPDEYIKKNGADRFRLLLERAAGDVEYRLIETGKKHELSTTEGQVAFLKEACELLSELQTPIERELYAGKLASQLSISKESILQQVAQVAARRRKQQLQHHEELTGTLRRETTQVRAVNPEAEKQPKAASAECALIGMLLLHPDRIARAVELIPPDQFVTGFNRGLYRAIADRAAAGMLVDIAVFSGVYNAEEMAYIAQMVQSARNWDGTDNEIDSIARTLNEARTASRLTSSEDMTPEEIAQLLQQLKKQKQ